MEYKVFQSLREKRIQVKLGDLATCFIASNMSPEWESWNKLPAAKKDVLREREICFVVELRESKDTQFDLAKIMYARGFGWVRGDSLTAVRDTSNTLAL